MTADDIIRALDLKPHPEGGHFRETFRDEDNTRGASTAIYYLLRRGERSHWHRVDAAEVWHFYAGDPLELALSADGRTTQTHVLGKHRKGRTPPNRCAEERLASRKTTRRLHARRLHGRAGLHLRRFRNGSTRLAA
jgi:predicted cupin superfamily sugar epimerase